MVSLSRRDFLYAGLAASANLAGLDPSQGAADQPEKANVHQQILDLGVRQQAERRKRFAAVASKADLEALQKSLRKTLLDLLDGLPERVGTPKATATGKIDGDDYTIEKLYFESFPGYFVTALLYKPKKIDGKLPGIISPCGHSPVGKAHGGYQTLHINLAKRGYIVLTYDPVGQGERSQFWDAAKGRSRFNLSCGEHGVLGNPLYLLGTSLARYRIHDGLRAIDYLVSLLEVDPERIGCIGSSGGGTLTSYISALDQRIKVAIPSCYITNLPRRMGNRIEKDPDADPEQDIYGFVSAGIDHAGLLALMVPRPTQVSAAKLDFFPIEGTRETFTEVKKLYEVAGAGDRIHLAEADEKHGLSQPLRKAAYVWFDRWLAGRKEAREDEIPVTPRPTKELLVTADGQVNVSLKSRPLLPLALEQFRKENKRQKLPLGDFLGLKEEDLGHFQEVTVDGVPKTGSILLLCINGNEARSWQDERVFLKAAVEAKLAVRIIDPRGVGALRPKLEIKGRDYADPLYGVEENIAYNAFLAGRSLLGMRVNDVRLALGELTSKDKPKQIVLCGRRDAALVATFAALTASVTHMAVEDMLLSYLPLFELAGQPINAASIVPCMLRDFGDIPDLLQALAPRGVLATACPGKLDPPIKNVQIADKGFTANPEVLLKWLTQ